MDDLLGDLAAPFFLIVDFVLDNPVGAAALASAAAIAVTIVLGSS